MPFPLAPLHQCIAPPTGCSALGRRPPPYQKRKGDSEGILRYVAAPVGFKRLSDRQLD